MIVNLLSSLMYVLRWFVWACNHLVFLPVGTLLLMCLFLFWLEGSTPGRMMADEITSVTQNVRPGEFRISGCDRVKDKQPHNSCHQTAITDAAGYAAHIDRSWGDVLKGAWTLLAVTFAILSFLTRTYPVYWRYGENRSDLFKNGGLPETLEG